MSSEISLGGAGIPIGSERLVPSDSVSKNRGSYGEANLSNVHSLKDLKQMELAGEKVTISDEQLIKALERSIKAIQGKSTTLEFAVHSKTKQIMVKIIDKDSGEVIREIPPEKMQDMVAKIWEMAGILVDERR